MNFHWLRDPLIKILFESDDIIAVDKPYGLDPHTNDSKKGNEDFVIPGLIELFEKQLGRKLHIIHRLDKTTTGVIVFGKSLESAKKYQQYFRARETKKTYVFVTASQSTKSSFHTDQVILHKGDELEASTDFAKIKAGQRFALWEAYPHTGRNHQIRIHAQTVGLSLLGDAKYGGAAYPFLCLHNRKIEFPNGVSIESPMPRVFEDLSLLDDRRLASSLFQIDRRERLFGRDSSLAQQSYRLIHFSSSDAREMALDQYGDVLNMSWFKERFSPQDDATYTVLSKILGKPILVRMMSTQARDKSGKHQQFVLNGTEFEQGETDGTKSWTALEGETKHELRVDAGPYAGLALEHRLLRTWVREHATDKTFLNLFSASGGFSLEAALGGAREVVSVDAGKNALNWSRRNFEINGLDSEKSKFLCRDVPTFLAQCKAKSEVFELIVCDPPAFSRGEKGIFKIDVELDALLKACLEVLAPGGTLLFTTGFEAFFVDDLRRAILKAQSVLKIKELELTIVQPSLDFELPGEKTIVKSFLIRKAIKTSF